jgi:FG-GAP-like repeat
MDTADVNLDGNLDVAISGLGGDNPNDVYFGNGLGSFVIGPTIGSVGGFQSLHFGDYDNDGDPDLITGGNGEIRRNDQGVFNAVSPSFLPYSTGSSNFYDANADGKLDVVQTGRFFQASENDAGRLWLQNNPHSFSETNARFRIMVERSEVQIRDSNCDTVKDLFFGVVPYLQADQALGYVYTNLGVNGFSRSRLPGIGKSSNSGLIDIEGDGFPEVVVVGNLFTSLVPQAIGTEILRRLPSGEYQMTPSLNLPRFRTASLAVVDYDGDRDEDLFIVGDYSPSGAIDDFSEAAFLFRNDTVQNPQVCRPQSSTAQAVPGFGVLSLFMLAVGLALAGLQNLTQRR